MVAFALLGPTRILLSQNCVVRLQPPNDTLDMNLENGYGDPS